MSRVCLCLTSASVPGAIEQYRRHRHRIDLVEIRVDRLRPSEREKAAEIAEAVGSGCPAILTVRLERDGGDWGRRGEDEAARRSLLLALLESGFWSYVDLESDRPMPEVASAASSSGVRIIRSRHEFGDFLSRRSVDELVADMERLGADGSIAKLAADCAGSADLLKLARLGRAVDGRVDTIILGMGEWGAPTRILADRMGSQWTYTSSIGSDPVAAPGQLDPELMVDLYRIREMTGNTPIYAVVGNPVAHSRSPRLHNRWLQNAGLPGTYLPIRADDWEMFLETCRLWAIQGLSVTVPFKRAALESADRPDETALKIGAANTLIRTGEGWRAANTDADGFLEPLVTALGLEDRRELKDSRALIIGAGGAARAVVHALADSGVRLVILNRSESKAEALAAEVGAESGPLDPTSRNRISTGIDFSVQTTSVGMHPLEEGDPLPWWDFGDSRLAYDLIYRPERTVFLERARQAGLDILNGSAMLEAQARRQFAMFTGRSD